MSETRLFMEILFKEGQARTGSLNPAHHMEFISTICPFRLQTLPRIKRLSKMLSAQESKSEGHLTVGKPTEEVRSWVQLWLHAQVLFGKQE